MRFSRRSASWVVNPSPPTPHPFPAHQRSKILRHAATLGSVAFVVGLTCAISGCSPSSESPLAPSLGGTVAGPNITAGPTITAVIPAAGSAAGGSLVKIAGTGFMPGMTVMFDDIKVTAQVQSQTATFATVEAPAHAVGPADLTVTNPDGQFQRVAAAFSYRTEDAFDMNGVWAGFTVNGTDTAVGFEIRNNTLVSATCAFTAAVPFVFSDMPRVQNGGFSLVAQGGATLAGRIVSANEILGTINFPACSDGLLPWRVTRRSD